MKRYISENNILEITISIIVIIGIILICMEYESPVYSTINKTKELKKTDFAMYKGIDRTNYIPVDSEDFLGGWDLDIDKTYCKDINENKIKNIVTIVNNKPKVTSDKTVYCYLYFYISGVKEWLFDYTGGEQEFIVPYTGTYKLETWGAQGGSGNGYTGGYGGYSVGNIILEKNKSLYINVGGTGEAGAVSVTMNYGGGGYNGGGTRAGFVTCSTCKFYSGGGGGATHIATTSGLLSTLENKKSEIITVSGGGGGNGYTNAGANKNFTGIASGGGIQGNNGNMSFNSFGGTQTTGYAFGQGRNCGLGVCDGGGGGFYGGIDGTNGAGGGSGYIGNSLLTNKHMTCYNCTTSDEESTKTISNTCVNGNAVSDCSKTGNGYAKITFIG